LPFVVHKSTRKPADVLTPGTNGKAGGKQPGGKTAVRSPARSLRPLSKEDGSELRQLEREEALAKLDDLAEQIARAWRSPQTAVKLIEEQRR
jgi:hypothetical protein